MSYHLKAGEPVEAEVRRLAADQLDRAFCELDDPALDRDETVHQARKRCKKLRGLLRLVRPAIRGKTYPRENRALRDAQRLLSPLRDARARLGSLALLRDAFDEVLDADALACVREAFAARLEGADAAEPVERFRSVLEDVRSRAQEWEIEAEGFDAIEAGVAKTYRRGRRAMRRAYRKGSAEAFYEWRKRVKYHLYHVRLMRESWPLPLEARRSALDQLADHLGDAHDLAVLASHLNAHPVAGLSPRGEARSARTDRRAPHPTATRGAADRASALRRCSGRVRETRGHLVRRERERSARGITGSRARSGRGARSAGQRVIGGMSHPALLPDRPRRRLSAAKTTTTIVVQTR